MLSPVPWNFYEPKLSEFVTKFANSQSNAVISVAYMTNYDLLLLQILMKAGPEVKQIITK